MPYEDLIVLIPSHSLEDFPAEGTESEAASLLNSFAVAWHPALLAATRVLPRWHRADDPPDASQKRLFFMPESCAGRLPCGWAERMAEQGSTVVRGSDRAEMLASALTKFETPPSVDPDLAADFMALGFCYLQIELLTRKMRHFSNLDEVHLQREAVAAAEAALAADHDTARTRLRSCFDVLHEARERFYPVDCYLLDLCLLIPRLADESLRKLLLTLKPVSILASAADLEEIAEKSPDVMRLVREACERGSADLVCGDLRELPLPLMPLNSILWQLVESGEIAEKLSGKRSTVWGRRRFGLFPQCPQFLKRAGFVAALHTVLDDGIYPDAEYSKLRWEGTDGTSIDALTRIPLAADGATSFLRFPDRMSESMDNDHVAGVIFARWPEVSSPFFEDLRRMSQYAPVLGRFVTLSDFFTNTDNPTRHSKYKPQEYLSPYLFQSVARGEADGISRYAHRFSRRQLLDTGNFLAGLTETLSGRSPRPAADLERTIEQLPELPTAEESTAVNEQLTTFVSASAERLARLILSGGGTSPGWLILNPVGFRRLVTVPVDRQGPLPQPTGEQSSIQWDAERAFMTVDVPGAGFVWVPAATDGMANSPATPPLADNLILRNEFFEVHLNEATGGIARIKGYGLGPGRLSQQVNYRFSRERTILVGAGDDAEETKTHYAEMRRLASEVTCTGPALGEIVTTGEIVDQQKGDRLAEYRQTTRVWRGRPIVEIEIELTPDRLPDAEPWHNYFAARFAWNDETASITQASLLGAHEVTEERIESPYYIELATSNQRTTLIAPGLPYHRKTGPRMLDTLLIVPGETRRKFQFAIAIDQDYPLQAALDATVPAVVIPTQQGPPRSGSAGWLFHLSARSVQLLGMLPLMAEPAELPDAEPTAEPRLTAEGAGCALRLMETEGRPVRTKLRCFRTPKSARQRDLLGKTVTVLTIEGDAVLVDLSPYELADVELRFS